MPAPSLKPMEAYLWNPRQWQGSRRVQRMDWAERGLYRELMDECYFKGSIPGTAEGVAELLGEDLEVILPLWPRVSACFKPDPEILGHVFSPHVEEVRAEQDALRKRQAERRKAPVDPSLEPEPLKTTVNHGEPRSTVDDEEGRKEGRKKKEKSKQSGGDLPPTPREAHPSPKPPAAAPGGAEKQENPETVPLWLAYDLADLGISRPDQEALHRRLGTLPLRAAAVQLRRKGNVRKPAALLTAKGEELAEEGAEFLHNAFLATLASAPGALTHPSWLGLPCRLQADPEVRTAWALHLAGQAHAAKTRGSGGELEGIDVARRSQAQLVKILRDRASPEELPGTLANGAVLAHFGLTSKVPQMVPIRREA